jgi:hypothetical protein
MTHAKWLQLLGDVRRRATVDPIGVAIAHTLAARGIRTSDAAIWRAMHAPGVQYGRGESFVSLAIWLERNLSGPAPPELPARPASTLRRVQPPELRRLAPPVAAPSGVWQIRARPWNPVHTDGTAGRRQAIRPAPTPPAEKPMTYQDFTTAARDAIRARKYGPRPGRPRPAYATARVLTADEIAALEAVATRKGSRKGGKGSRKATAGSADPIAA